MRTTARTGGVESELGAFLRRQREALTPFDLQLAPGRRRRVKGLRREEVASLASISTSHYTRIEQARGPRPKEPTVAAIARALRLTPEKRTEFYELAGYRPPPASYRTDETRPELLRVLGLVDLPAEIVSDLGVTLAQNALARALVGDQTHHIGLDRSGPYRWFTDESERRARPEDEHAGLSRAHVAALREVQGAPQVDPEADELVDRLRDASEEFRALWEQPLIGTVRAQSTRLLHPLVGPIDLERVVLAAEGTPQALVVHVPLLGTDATSKMGLLAVVGSSGFESG